jgi:hypothetical protein
MAFALRMVGLAYRPMSPAEVEQAWTALSLLAGQSGLSAPAVSPLLLSLQSVTFALASASEGFARFWPALAGTLTVMLPYGLRQDLGRVGALFASLLLAVSTSMLFWSRSATGESLAILGGLGLVVGLAHLRRTRTRRWTLFSLAMLSTVLLAGPSGYSVLVLVAPLAYLAWRSRESDPRYAAESVSEGPKKGPAEPSSGRSSALSDMENPGEGEREREPAGQSDLVGSAVIFVVLLLLGSTAMFLNPGGLAVLADVPGHWFAQFGNPGPYSPLRLILQLILTEPLLVASGLAGLVLGLRQRHWLAEGLGVWLALGLLLLLVRAGRSPGDVALLVVPLALLGGMAIAFLASALVIGEQAVEAALLLAAGVAIVGSMAIWLANYVASWPVGPQHAFLISALAALGVLLGVLILYVFLFGSRFTTQVGILLLLLVLGLLGLRAAMRANHSSDGLVWGSLLHEVGATDAQNLPAYLERLSAQRGGDLRDLDVTVLVQPGHEPSPLLRWYLRGANVRLAAGAGDAGRQDVLVGLSDYLPPGEAGYSGRSFRLTQWWTPQGLRGEALWRWLLYGHFDQIQGEERAIVWLPVAN